LNTEEASIAAMIEQVHLRPVQVADAAALAELYRSQRTFLTPFDPVRPDGFYTVEGQRRELEECVAQRAADLRHRFLIMAGDRLRGALSISNVIRGPFQSAHLGYFVAEQLNGRGVGTAAVAEAVERAFGSLRLHRLQAGTLVDNIGSQRVLEKNGFERIGVAHNYLEIAGAWRDHVLFQRIAP
jgi:ribosomal-protein-alanine N-acetyltransferase